MVGLGSLGGTMKELQKARHPPPGKRRPCAHSLPWIHGCWLLVLVPAASRSLRAACALAQAGGSAQRVSEMLQTLNSMLRDK